MADDADKPAVLIIGGLGHIGRFLALHIHRNRLASEVRLVDKVLPQLAWLAPEFDEACSADKFLQADASREQSMARIFDRPGGREFDYVFNCGGETRFSQDDEVYRVRSLALSTALGNEAARRRVRAFVCLSTGMVYKPDPVPRKETDKTKPWLKMAKFKLLAEEELERIDGCVHGNVPRGPCPNPGPRPCHQTVTQTLPQTLPPELARGLALDLTPGLAPDPTSSPCPTPCPTPYTTPR